MKSSSGSFFDQHWMGSFPLDRVELNIVLIWVQSSYSDRALAGRRPRSHPINITCDVCS